MRRKDKNPHHRRVSLAVEALDDRQLLSGGAAGGWAAVPSGPFLAAKSPGEAAEAAIESAGRVSTPESRQAISFLPRGTGCAGVGLRDARHRERRAGPAARPHPLMVRSLAPAVPAPTVSGRGPSRMRIGGMVVTTPPGSLSPADLRFVALAIPANATAVTQAIIDLTNHVRVENHMSPLSENAALMEGAQLHSQDMARVDQLLHDIPGVPLATLPDRAAYVGYPYQLLGENIAYNQADPASVVASWMDSPLHRENMLNPTFTDIGVGLAWNRRGEPYYTMMLGQPA
jgi:uncharacterized protein YkwD